MVFKQRKALNPSFFPLKTSLYASRQRPTLPACLQSNAQAGAEPGERDAPPPPRPLPQPAGNLLLTVDSLSLAGAGGVESFFVLKCGPFWARSKPLPCTGKPKTLHHLGALQCMWSALP